MSKEKATTKVTQTSKSAGLWERAISDAQAQINEAKNKIVRLRQAVRGFEVLRDKGAPWPGLKARETSDRLNGGPPTQ
jgi:5-bromo-4-chloroindolyl phosphate hydrolysis protein